MKGTINQGDMVQVQRAAVALAPGLPVSCDCLMEVRLA